MTSPADSSSLLGDILAATTAAPAPAVVAAPLRALSTADLLRLTDADLGRLLGGLVPDDLLVLCRGEGAAWTERVLALLDADSGAWLSGNLAQLDPIAPAHLSEVRERVVAAARSLLKSEEIVLPPADLSGSTDPFVVVARALRARGLDDAELAAALDQEIAAHLARERERLVGLKTQLLASAQSGSPLR